jgi:hypothetical protein
MSVPVPWTLGVPGCGAMRQSGSGGSFRPCTAQPTHCGVRLHRSSQRRQLECWLVFACPDHVGEIDAARPLLQRDEVLRQTWLQERQQALAGRRWERPTPLATGADAKTLHERALAWAAR